MNTISTIEASGKLSELIAAAGAGEPQFITNHGGTAAVLISYEDYRRLLARQKSLVEFLRESPLSGSDIDLERLPAGAGRAPLSFDEEIG